MARLTCAAMIYQHATRDRDQAIAKALGTFVRDARGTKEDSTEGPERGEQGDDPQERAARVWVVLALSASR